MWSSWVVHWGDAVSRVVVVHLFLVSATFTMSGRGRGRGRGRGGIPINYPDGMTCKVLHDSRYPEIVAPLGLLGRGGLPAPPALTAADKELLEVRKRLHAHPTDARARADVEAYRTTGKQRSRDFVRYSDRYLNVAPKPFHQASQLSMLRGVHFPGELVPAPKGGGKRKRGAGAPRGRAASQVHGLTLGDDLGDVDDVLEAVGDRAEGDGEEDGDAAQKLERVVSDAAEAAERDGEDGDDFGEEDEEEDDDELLDAELAGMDDCETGGDDPYSDAGDDEPTY
jgi:hypothetical protein